MAAVVNSAIKSLHAAENRQKTRYKELIPVPMPESLSIKDVSTSGFVVTTLPELPLIKCRVYAAVWKSSLMFLFSNQDDCNSFFSSKEHNAAFAIACFDLEGYVSLDKMSDDGDDKHELALHGFNFGYDLNIGFENAENLSHWYLTFRRIIMSRNFTISQITNDDELLVAPQSINPFRISKKSIAIFEALRSFKLPPESLRSLDAFATADMAAAHPQLFFAGFTFGPRSRPFLQIPVASPDDSEVQDLDSKQSKQPDANQQQQLYLLS